MVIDVPVSLSALVLGGSFFAGAVLATALAKLRFNELSTASAILCAEVCLLLLCACKPGNTDHLFDASYFACSEPRYYLNHVLKSTDKLTPEGAMSGDCSFSFVNMYRMEQNGTARCRRRNETLQRSNLESLLLKTFAPVKYLIQELEFNYPTTKGKVYSEEEDLYLLCHLTYIHGLLEAKSVPNIASCGSLSVP